MAGIEDLKYDIMHTWLSSHICLCWEGTRFFSEIRFKNAHENVQWKENTFLWSVWIFIWNNIWECTQERNHFLVIFVKLHFKFTSKTHNGKKTYFCEVCGSTFSEFTETNTHAPESSYILVMFAILHVQLFHVWKCIRRDILQINYNSTSFIDILI